MGPHSDTLSWVLRVVRLSSEVKTPTTPRVRLKEVSRHDQERVSTLGGAGTETHSAQCIHSQGEEGTFWVLNGRKKIGSGGGGKAHLKKMGI